MLFLHILFHYRISKHQLNLWAIPGVQKKQMVNKIVAKVIVAPIIKFDPDL